ncbi:DUF421 domain-containing protein [Microbacteriaceae bacterium 4G12]
MDFFSIVGRTILLYAVIILIFRLMGKREIGQLSVVDLLVFIMLGEMAVFAVENIKKPLWHQIVPMFTLMIIQISLAFISLKSQKARRLLEGEPSIIIRAGKIDEKEMRRHRYNFDDLLVQLREKDIGDIREVEYAILEPTGKLSVFQKQKSKKSKNSQSVFTFPLVIDGVIQEDNLQKMDKTNLWLRQKLRDLGYYDVKQISFCSFQDGQFFVDKKDDK